MEKEKLLFSLAAISCLVIGLLLGAFLFPQEIIVEKEVPVEVEIEVEKDFLAYKDEAVVLCFEEFVDEFDPTRYQDIKLRDISDEWSIEFATYFWSGDITTVFVDELEVRVFDTLLDNRTDYVFNCKVEYREDKYPKVIWNFSNSQ